MSLTQDISNSARYYLNKILPQREFKRIVVHDARHHFDETLAVHIMKTIFPDIEVITTREIDEYLKDPYTLFADVSGKYDGIRFFDHHQEGSPEYEMEINGKMEKVRYSASGQIWHHFGHMYLKKLFPEKKRQEINAIHKHVSRFLVGHDIWDNGYPPELFEKLRKGETIFGFNIRLAKTIESFNPTFQEMPIFDRKILHQSPRPADIKAQQREREAFDSMSEVMNVAFPLICEEAAKTTEAGKTPFDPLPAIQWLYDIPSWKNFSSFTSYEWEPTATIPELYNIQKELFKRSDIISRSRDRNVINAYAGNIRSAYDMVHKSKQKKWNSYFSGLPEDALKRIAVIIGKKDEFEAGHYYFPWNYVTEAVSDLRNRFDVAIAPATDGGWVALPAYTENRLRFPSICGGAHDEDLITCMNNTIHDPNIIKRLNQFKNGSCFCHKAGFLMAARTLDILVPLVGASLEINERVKDTPRGYNLTPTSPEVRRRTPPREKSSYIKDILKNPKNNGPEY